MGNLDSKSLSPQYEIIDEPHSPASSSSTDLQHHHSLSATATATPGAAAGGSFGPLPLINPNNLSIWNIKRAHITNQQSRHALVYEHVTCASKKELSTALTLTKQQQQLRMALTQIQTLKTVRHPNIVKYYFSDEHQETSPSSSSSSSSSAQHAQMRHVLVVEWVRPLAPLLHSLNAAEIGRGLYAITSALAFCHDKLRLSHNNVGLDCVYLSSKQQAWKLNDFELAIRFDELSAHSVRAIREFKSQQALTPEEQSLGAAVNEQTVDDEQMSVTLRQFPHAIDAYGWCMLVRSVNREHATAAAAAVSLSKHSVPCITKTQSTMNMMDDVDEAASLGDNDDAMDAYVSWNACLRPTLSSALNLRLFDAYRNNAVAPSSSSSSSSSPSPPSSSSSSSSSGNKQSKQTTKQFSTSSMSPAAHWHKVPGDDEEDTESATTPAAAFDPYRLSNLDELEASWPQLVKYLEEKTNMTANVGNKAWTVDEKIVDLLLSPFMFFSSAVRTHILPNVLISKNDYEAAARTRKDDTALLFYHSCLSSPSDYGQYVGGGSTAPADSNESTRLRPFIDAHKYKAFVLPRILHLFTMHITPIRIMLLQYFPFYIDLIDDKYMLEHELLPELLKGLTEEDEDQMASLTFSCLAKMVELLGSAVVVGRRRDTSHLSRTTRPVAPHKLFSNAVPKTIVHRANVNDTESLPRASAATLSKVNSTATTVSIHRNASGGISIQAKNKVLSDSMIGLHDDNESFPPLTPPPAAQLPQSSSGGHVSRPAHLQMTASYSNSVDNNDDDDDDDDDDENDDANNDEEVEDDDWSNDFGWNSASNQGYENNEQEAKTSETKRIELDKSQGAAQGMLTATPTLKSPLSARSSSTAAVVNDDIDEISSRYDIKSMKLVANGSGRGGQTDTHESLVDSFLSEMAPVIQKPTTFAMMAVSPMVGSSNNSNMNYRHSDEKNVLENERIEANSQWECDNQMVDIDD